jgi:hypothetical protein
VTLIVAGRESRMVRLTIEVEAAVAVGIVQSTPKIERIRFEDGRWRKASLLVQRLRALGASVDMSSIEVKERGSHTPVF